MSHFTASGLEKRNNIHVYILQQNPKSGYIRIQFMLLALIMSRVQFYQFESQHNCDVNYVSYVNFYVYFVASKRIRGLAKD